MSRIRPREFNRHVIDIIERAIIRAVVKLYHLPAGYLVDRLLRDLSSGLGVNETRRHFPLAVQKLAHRSRVLLVRPAHAILVILHVGRRPRPPLRRVVEMPLVRAQRLPINLLHLLGVLCRVQSYFLLHLYMHK